MNSTGPYACYSQDPNQVQYEQQHEQQQQQLQYWEQHSYGASTSALEAPVFNNPFDHKYSALQVQVAQPSFEPSFEHAMFAQQQHEYAQYDQQSLFIDQHQQHQQHQQSFIAAPQPQVYVDMAPFAASYTSSPTLSDLSCLSSSGFSTSPLSPPHLLTPISPVSAGAHFSADLDRALFVRSPAIEPMSLPHQYMMLQPMPLEVPSSSLAHAMVQVQVLPEQSTSATTLSPVHSGSLTPPATQTPPPSTTTSTGPAIGEFAVLTITGHTIAASGKYKDVLDAAKSVRKANESGLLDDSRTCHFCGKVCDRPSTLRTHLNSHTGARPHTCTVPGCGRQFTVLSNMYRHAKACAAQRAREVRRASAARR
jgi:hypothetical protein